MNLLFDFISLQDTFINGGAEYTRRILNELIHHDDIYLFGLMSRTKSIPGFLHEIIIQNSIKYFFIQDSLKDIVVNNHIDKFYIGISQRYNDYDLTDIPCTIILTCHDVGDLCNVYDNKIKSVRLDFVRKYSKVSLIKRIKNTFSSIYHCFKPFEVSKFYNNFAKLIKQDNVFLITDSEYSISAITYFFDDIYNQIKCFFAPLKETTNIENKIITNPILKKLINLNKKYFLLLNCERYNKNAALVAEMWKKFCKETNSEYYVVFVGKIDYKADNIIQIDSLSMVDLDFAYKNAYALLYPSVTEGFGYPPIEAMRFGTPSLCSNVTSIPEVCDNSVIYFSPYYPEDLFKAMIKLCKNREYYSIKAFEQYKLVAAKQKEDFKALIEYILNV